MRRWSPPLPTRRRGSRSCEAAATVAYKTGDIYTITVTGANDEQLSIGKEGMKCLGKQ
jgi:hypothetical protein